MLKVLLILLIFLISSCATPKKISPDQYVYKVHDSKGCYYKGEYNPETATCKDVTELQGYLLIHPQAFRNFVMKNCTSL